MNRAMKLPQAMPEDAGLEPRRQAVIDVLKDRFARGEIELAEYERRITAAADAQRVADLAALVNDLGRSAVPPSLPEAKQQFVTVMSSRNQRGDWLQADAVVVYVLMGVGQPGLHRGAARRPPDRDRGAQHDGRGQPQGAGRHAGTGWT